MTETFPHYVSLGHYTAERLLRDACRSGLVVDAGAFPGGLTRVLARRWKVIALDIDPERGVTSCERFKEGLEFAEEPTFAESMQTIGVEARRVDIELDPWPLDTGSADAVVLTEVVEHLYTDPLHVMLEVNRVLKPSGVFLVSTPNLLSLSNRLAFLRGDMATVIQAPFLAFLQRKTLGHYGHVRLYAPAELNEMLTAVGFTSAFYFYDFQFWDTAPGSPPPQLPEGSKVSPPQCRSILRKVFRSPRSYARAVVATVSQRLVRRHPRLRSHMYVVATKTRSVEFGELSVPQFESA